LIPFFIPSVISLIFNAGLLIMILAYFFIKNKPAVTLFFSAILPHGLIEIPTMIFVAGFSLYLSSQMTRRIFRKKGTWTARSADLFGFVRQDELPDRVEAFGSIVEVFTGVIVPLVLIAALVETFITPLILRLFAR
jgi:stage II sporulation protein M